MSARPQEQHVSDNTNPERAQTSDKDKLRRERELLLTTFEPSIPSISTAFTEPAGDFSVTDDETGEKLAAWLEKKQQKLREATGVDWRTDEEKNA